ncbi:MICAL-like protein 1 [Styela clava]
MANKGMKGLLTWCKKHTEGYRDVNITNMTSSWSSGLGFCALLHRFRPDLIDFESLSKENVFYNHQLAFGIAEKELGIAALLDAEDMAEMAVPDRLSVMTYLAQYYNCFRHCKPEETTQPDAPVLNPVTAGSPSKTASPQRRSTDDSICCICGKRVHLVQRYFDEGKLYHRTCHRNDSLEKIRGKNYFIKHQDEPELPKKNVNDEEKAKTAVEQETTKNVVHKPVPTVVSERENYTKPNRLEELPNMVQSLADAEVKTVNMAEITPSPTTENKPLPNNPNDVAPSLVSELPVARHTNKQQSEIKSSPTKPKPRARTLHSNEEKPIAPVPVARPRSKDVSNDSNQVEDNSKASYRKSLNPFELESGSDSDTTLSSTSSEEDGNPFEITPKVQERKEDASKNERTEDKLTEIINDENSADEGGNPFGDPPEIDQPEEVSNKESDNEGNPFGDADEEEPKNKAVDRVNPFNTEVYKNSAKLDDKIVVKKKRPAPAPPKSTSALLSTQSPHKKTAAPSRPPGWKDTSSQKMVELNKANEKDPRYTKNSTKPQSSSKARAMHKSPKARSAPGYGYPLVKRKVEIKMSEQEIANELKLLDVQLTDYETKGVKLEEMLRFAMDSECEWTSEEDELLQEWFQLVNKKNQLLRQESDLVFQMQQQKHEQEHADIEFQLRKLFNKPESTKTDQDKIDEENLLQKLLEVVERRNVIVNSIEEERVKEAEEDSAYEKMKRLQQNPSKKKKKNKVKKMFSKKGKTDKENTAKTK